MSDRTTLLEFWQHNRSMLEVIERVISAYEGSQLSQRLLRKAALGLDAQLRIEVDLPREMLDREGGYPFDWVDPCLPNRRLAEDALHSLMVALANVTTDNPWDGSLANDELQKAANSYRSAIYFLEDLPDIKRHIYEEAKRMVEIDAVLDGDDCDSESDAVLDPFQHLPLQDSSAEIAAPAPSNELRKKYRDPDNYWRNVWLYEQRKAGKTNTTILCELGERAEEFAPLDSDNALRAAIDSIAEFHGWPILKGKPGRPKATGGNAKTLSGNPQTPQ